MALSIVKQKKPDISLHIAGISMPRITSPGYIRYINKIIINLDLQDNIPWLGPLDSNNIANQLLESSISVIPSYVESYSLALHEALTIGTPTICSYAGAMPEVSNITNKVHFFQAGDFYKCAKLILNNLSQTNVAPNDDYIPIDAHKAVIRQIDIYKKILNFY